MIKEEILPIGAVLKTSRASQIFLAQELFPNDVSVEYDDYMQCIGGTCIVTAENKHYLSKVPLIGDLVMRRELESGQVAHPQLWKSFNIFDGELVEKRTYPNGLREPLIKWDNYQYE